MAALPTVSVVRRVGIAVAVAGALALTSGRASAECGDHVTILDGRTADRAESGPGADHDRPKQPCHGPGCTNRPSTPLAPPAAPASHSTDAKASLVGPHDPDEDGSCGFMPPASDLDPIDRPTSIFHPPRA